MPLGRVRERKYLFEVPRRRSSSWLRAWGAVAFAMALLFASHEARADDKLDEVDKAAKEEAAKVNGVEKNEHLAGDAGRDFANVLLFVPRKITEFMLWSSSVAIGVLEKQPVVPRVQEAVSAGEGRVIFLPTVFAETTGIFSIGARMITDFHWVATALRVGFGGPHSFELEPRITFVADVPIRSLISFEALYRLDNYGLFLGIGQVPATDSRNTFRHGKAGETARFFEKRVRFVGSYAFRLSNAFEILLSGSLDRREDKDAQGVDENTMSKVFFGGSVVGSDNEKLLVYGEAAVRFDTRPTRGRPSAGLMAETYAGTARAILHYPQTQFVRLGGRAAAFIPLYRKTNILSPRFVLDSIAPIGKSPIPFTELAGEPDFRGYDERRDRFSTVMSLDYRWLIVEHVAPTIFFDATTVGPSLDALQLKHLRWVGGVSLDLHRDETVLGKLALAVGPEGPRLLFSIGETDDYGDRQHRD